MRDLQDDIGFDASSQARQDSGILTPASNGSPSHEGSTNPVIGKRKRDGDTMEDLLDDSFVVKPHPSTVFDKPRSLRPIALLPRAHLPLSYLDLSPSSRPIPESRLFEAHVKILELEQRMGNTPMVMIARLDDGKSLYAIEIASRGLYVLCKLGSWVDLDKLCATAVVSRHRSQMNTSRNSEKDLSFQTVMTDNPITLESSKYNKKKRLAIEAIQSLVKRPSGDSSSTVPVAISAGNEDIPETQIDVEQVNDKTTSEDIVKEPTADEILNNIRLQYFETLYLSKASLAYFAKGPLSRARAAFHLDYDSTLDMKDLVKFLENLVLPTNLLDKKYKDGLPSVISEIDIINLSADDTQKLPEMKKRRAKKTKLGKNGLYSDENTFVRQWYETHDPNPDIGGHGESSEDIVKTRLSHLRIRETQLQLIVILETLALQALAGSSEVHNGELPSISSGVGVDILADNTATVRSKVKKPQDIADFIDIHVDRLCIWQSVAAEEGRAGPKSSQLSKFDHPPVNGSNADKQVVDVLRDFCVEVIVPFFSGRLPVHCKTISRKLGGPVVSSSSRPSMKKSASFSAIPTKPGAVTKRPVPAKPRRSLQRVLTDERYGRSGSRGPAGAISLMRSATAPTVPGIKREDSETPSLKNIPSADSQSMFVSRGGVQKSKKFSQREVDLSYPVSGAEPKVKKMDIEAELKDAISALKRPNRQLAGQSIAEVAEKRASSAVSSRKSKKPVRNPQFQAVQITATPKSKRQKDMIFGSPPPKFVSQPAVELDTIPPSSMPRIPQSTLRPINDKEQFCEATPVRQRSTGNVLSTIQATPIRGQAFLGVTKFTSYGSEDNLMVLPSSPLPHKSLVPYGSAKENGLYNPFENTTIQVTPCRPKSSSAEQFHVPIKPLSLSAMVASREDTKENINDGYDMQPEGDNKSIYQTLGWDDLDDLL